MVSIGSGSPPPPNGGTPPWGMSQPGRWSQGARQIRNTLSSALGDLSEASRQPSTFSVERALHKQWGPRAVDAYNAAQWAVRPTRVLAEHPYSRERQAVTYGGQNPREIVTSRIQMARPGNLSENAREMAQRRNVLNYEGETGQTGQGLGLPADMSPPGGSLLDFGVRPPTPMPSSSRPDDRLHRQSSGVLWGDTHTQAMGTMWADTHTQAVAGIGLPGRDPIPGIRAPRRPMPLWTPPSY
jgi:hypothetical protein